MCFLGSTFCFFLKIIFVLCRNEVEPWTRLKFVVSLYFLDNHYSILWIKSCVGEVSVRVRGRRTTRVGMGIEWRVGSEDHQVSSCQLKHRGLQPKACCSWGTRFYYSFLHFCLPILVAWRAKTGLWTLCGLALCLSLPIWFPDKHLFQDQVVKQNKWKWSWQAMWMRMWRKQDCQGSFPFFNITFQTKREEIRKRLRSDRLLPAASPSDAAEPGRAEAPFAEGLPAVSTPASQRSYIQEGESRKRKKSGSDVARMNRVDSCAGLGTVESDMYYNREDDIF